MHLHVEDLDIYYNCPYCEAPFDDIPEHAKSARWGQVCGVCGKYFTAEVTLHILAFRKEP